jgi:hypothetical protein
MLCCSCALTSTSEQGRDSCFAPSGQSSCFRDVVARAWHCPLSNAGPFHRLDWLLRNTICVLQSWSDRKIGNIRMQLAVVKEVLHQLEVKLDYRLLATHEENIKQFVKLKTLGLASLQCNLVRQESRILWL